MTQLSVPLPASRWSGHPAMREENITLRPQSVAGLSTALVILGALGLGGVAVASMSQPKHALGAALMGMVIATGLSLGALFWTMVFHLTNAGWSGTVRRQLENMASLLPVCGVFFLVFAAVEFGSGGVLLSWLSDSAAIREDPILHHKAGFLNPAFVLVRLVAYFTLWTLLARLTAGGSRRQDASGDRFINNRVRFHCSYGMLLFGLSMAFFSFDWIKAVADYRFFSTMFGVHFFAGCAVSSIPALVVVLTLLRRAGKLHGAVTEEHYHDLGKLTFGFVVFWAYISFSQYFLIWYSNIPEETAFFVARKTGQWEAIATALAVGHFIVPWYILLWRRVRRTPALLCAMSVYMLVLHALDVYWYLRPAVDAGEHLAHPDLLPGLWIDLAGVIGVVSLWAGLLVRRIASAPLVPLNDPRLGESLAHKNYV